MHSVAAYLVIAAAAAAADAPEVELTTLSGEPQRGRLTELSASSAVLSQGEGDVPVPLENVMRLVLTGDSFADAAGDQYAPAAALVDGSRFQLTQVVASAREMTFETPSFGKVALSPTSVISIRLAHSDSNVEGRWQELCNRETAQDLLVIRKGDVLDHVAGLVVSIDAEHVRFLLDGEEIPLPREKVFGAVYARRRPATGKPLCAIKLRGADVVQATDVTLTGETLRTDWLSGAHVEIPVKYVSSIDFSFGKLQYLSDLEPREVKYTPYFDVTWEYRRDSNLDGGPIRLGNRTYARGLAIHSRTYLRYRIGGEYRRFQAIMGIDEVVADKGNVHVVIQADGKTLLETDVLGTDPPQPIDLDVTNVRDLEILVDFGGDLDIADHLDLADARVIK